MLVAYEFPPLRRAANRVLFFRPNAAPVTNLSRDEAGHAGAWMLPLPVARGLRGEPWFQVVASGRLRRWRRQLDNMYASRKPRGAKEPPVVTGRSRAVVPAQPIGSAAVVGVRFIDPNPRTDLDPRITRRPSPAHRKSAAPPAGRPRCASSRLRTAWMLLRSAYSSSA